MARNEDTRYQRILNGAATYASYYRANPHRFAKDYLHIELRLFQKLIIYMMNKSTQLVFSASRGIGKSFLIAVFCCIRCILYPGTKVVIASGTRSQSIAVLEKIITELIPSSPELAAEITERKINGTEAIIRFENGSFIKVVSANENARSNRSTILVCDEYRLMKKHIVDTILRKFLTQRRMPKYADLTKEERNKEYDKEKNGTYYLSSAYYKSSWAWDKCKDVFAQMLNPDKQQFIIGLPYQVPLKEGLISKETIEDELSESTTNMVTFSMEYLSEWYGSTEGAFFQFDDLAKNRNITYPFYPDEVSIKLGSNKQIGIPMKEPGEIRILSVDVALMSSSKNKNDASAIYLNSMKPTKNMRYISNIVYGETHEGLRTDSLALKIRKMFDDFRCDYIALDTNGIGLSCYDLLAAEIIDHNTGIIYPALSCYNNKEMADRCADRSAPKVIWSIKANAQFNSDCAYLLREGFKASRIRLLLNEVEADEALGELKGYNKLSPSEIMMFKQPYIDTTLLIDELTNLMHDESQGRVRIFERSGRRKDRYSSLSYNYWVALQIEQKLRRKRSAEFRSEDLGLIKPPVSVTERGGRKYAPIKKHPHSWRG